MMTEAAHSGSPQWEITQREPTVANETTSSGGRYAHDVLAEP